MSISPRPERLACEFRIYFPFTRPSPEGWITLAFYTHRSGDYRRVGTISMPGPDAEAFVQLMREAGVTEVSRAELGLPGPKPAGPYVLTINEKRS